jgi:hypothetical protein
LEARRLSALGRTEQKSSSLTDATLKHFDDAFARWRIAIDRYPLVFADRNMEDIYEIIQDYRRLRRDRREPMPQKFILQDVVEAFEQN